MIVFGIRPTSKESLKISLGSDVIEFSAFCVTRWFISLFLIVWKKKKKKKKFTRDNETNRARAIYRALIHRYPGTDTRRFFTNRLQIYRWNSVNTHQPSTSPQRGNFPPERGEKIVAASRKSEEFHATSWHVREIREGKWERNSGNTSGREAINRFLPRCSLTRSEEAVFSAWRITESPTESIDFSTLEASKLPRYTSI